MDHKIRQIIENSILKSKKQKKEFLLFSRIMVFIQDPLISDSVDFDEVVSNLEKFMPPHLFEDIDIIYIGQYQDLIDRGLEALYESGAIYITNTLSENVDYVENIIHENAHSIEDAHGISIYVDVKVNSEFICNSKRLFNIIKSQDYDISGFDYLQPKFDQ